MGRLAILLVFFAILGANQASVSRMETRYNTDLTQSDYEEKVLARETAESALELIVGKIKVAHRQRFLSKNNEPVNYDFSLTEDLYRQRKYETRSTEIAPGDISVFAKGSLGINEYAIDAKIEFLYGGKLTPLTFDGEYEDVKINATNKMSVSGIDRKTDGFNTFLGSDGEGVDVNAVSVRSKKSYDDFFDNAETQNLEGVRGEGDIVHRDPGMDLQILASQIAAYTGPNRVTFEDGGQITNKKPLGAKDDPKITVVNGDFKMKNQSEGYGVLLVNGSLDIGAGSRFEGFILVMGANRTIDIGGNVEIYGALASHFDDDDDGQTTINIGGDARIQYSSEALIRVGEFITSLNKDNNQTLVVTRVNEGASRKDGYTALKRSY